MDQKEANIKRISYPALLDFVCQVLTSLGVPECEAELVSESLVDADLKGVHSHGVVRLPIYAERLRAGVINAKPNIKRKREQLGSCIVDGDNGLGHLVGHLAMEVAIDKARANSVPSFVAVEHSNHYGAAGYFVEQATRADMIGFSFTVGAINHMAPWGGREALLGNNPFAIGLPRMQGQPPVILDMACSVAARGKIIVAARNGERIPADWALDLQGRPTTDPIEALKGLVQPVGGPKGYALTLVVGLLSTMLTSALFGSGLRHLYEDLENEQNSGHLMGVLPINLFTAPEAFSERMSQVSYEIHNAEKASGVEEIYLPGEREHLSRERAIRDGVPLGTGVIEDLKACGRQHGAKLPIPY
ncbi:MULTISPECIES: Ldh family oxidoreductase [unclassified Halomonas]|uniref:Ldh family oxidoreductase n=1 Tax=unclassified Halomonas TaxID=2609666 RepID=UPI001EF729DA|nr:MULTISPECIES: Ldh family oxidoreductase [unclassified Halomonas]MCP1344463.1 Ldh family oxidoreductase [Halomonas sp. FL8]MCP1362784.1 Ldh family oxidoreductase [Halomonas sp. BBD45]MCP1363705.1 Ldh family oxidoreductase [Halomonas sp. BBD48]